MAMKNSTSVDEALVRKGLEPGFVEKLLPQMVELVRYSRLLPQGEEHAIRRGSRDFLASSRDLGERSLGAAHQIFCFLAQSLHQGSKPEDLKNFNLLVDSIDDALEKVDGNLRDAKSGKQGEEVEEEEPAPTPSTGSHVARTAKPQVRWRQLVDNHRTRFVPRLLVKHNEQTPLSPKLVEAQCKVGIRPGAVRNLTPEQTTVSEEPLPHPYDEELSALSWPDDFFRPRPATRYNRMEDTPLIMVRTEAELKEMVEEIKGTCVGSEIAVDVEHHDFRSFRGFVCLIQVSTRKKDFLIDPFDIFEQLHMLNEVFSDPRIVKVLHGADRDVLWLQRDFSVYLVNMFDTGLATRALRLQGGYSLANLVSHFCGVKLDKKYQTADWRERPLPTEMVHYARADTHYLLFCYDCLKNALLAQSGMAAKSGVNVGITALENGDVEATDEGVQNLQAVMQKSAGLCATVYRELPHDGASEAASLCDRYGSKQRALEPKQMSVLKALTDWRDQLARSIDESLNFVAPDACLWRVSLAMPTSPVKLRSTCNPLPATLQQHAQEVVDIVVKCALPAVDGGSGMPDPEEKEQSKERSAPASASPRESLPSPPEAEDSTGEVTATTRGKAHEDWPVRLEQSPRPLVHVTASFGFRQGSGEPGLKRKLSVLCGDSGSEEPPAGDDDGKPQKGRARVIRRKISFASPAPPAAIIPTKASEPPEAREAVHSETPGSGPASETARAAPEAAEAEEVPAPLRKRKKKRRRPEVLEQTVETQVAAKPPAASAQSARAGPAKMVEQSESGMATSTAKAAAPVSGQAPEAKSVGSGTPLGVAAAPKSGTAAAPAEAAPKAPGPEMSEVRPKRKVVKRKKVVQETVVDPYL
ncbi:Exosc10 [Symbiodinium natans]|uniref:Exosc10 protein n=1 Tax=Symbiodinium natans TaxID=878477 RepID=A0A812JB19_9DINO|nr:Exosc10 [Symbiodinium natans]